MEPQQERRRGAGAPSVLAGTMELLDGTPGRPRRLPRAAGARRQHRLGVRVHAYQVRGPRDAPRPLQGRRAWSCSASRRTTSAGRSPGRTREIADFCSINYGVQFPVFARIATTGPEAAPLYAGRAGRAARAAGRAAALELHQVPARSRGPAGRSRPTTEPDDAALTGAIESLLSARVGATTRSRLGRTRASGTTRSCDPPHPPAGRAALRGRVPDRRPQAGADPARGARGGGPGERLDAARPNGAA